MPPAVHHPLAQTWTLHQSPIPRAPDTKAEAFAPRPGLPFRLHLWGMPPFLWGREPPEAGGYHGPPNLPQTWETSFCCYPSFCQLKRFKN